MTAPRSLATALSFSLALALSSGLAAPQAQAQPPAVRVGLQDGGPSWSQLTPEQRDALAPLQRDWNDLGPERRAKWLQVAQRYRTLPPDERQRMQARMQSWARMSPQARGEARQAYEQARSVPRGDRQARWQQYQALTPEQRRELAAGATGKAAETGPRRAEARAAAQAPRAPVQPKSTLVPNPSLAPPPKAVAPAVVQARPGATTNLISKPPKPPLHQQTGLPKIAASPGLVDSKTLLPQRGPQGAAVPPRASSPPGADARR